MAGLFESEQVGKIPDLADIISNVESAECPFTSMIPKLKKPLQAKQTWQLEAYPKDGHGGVMDGKDADSFTSVNRSEVDGRSQKVWNNPAISDFAGEAKIAGLSRGEMANQIAKSIVRVKRIIERRCLSNEDCQVDNGTDKANETRGLVKWLSTTAQGVYPVPEAFRPASDTQISGALTAVTETAFKAACRAAYKKRNGANTLDGFLGIDLKAKLNDWFVYTADVSNFTAVRQFNQDAKDGAIQLSVDTLLMDTGKVRLHPTSFLYTDKTTGEDTAYTHRSGVLVMMEMLGLGYNRWPRVQKLENKGGGERAFIDMALTLMVLNPKGFWKFQP
jgi:hypothetical protein